MPLILSDSPVPDISLSIWHITETEQELLQNLELSPRDLKAILSLRLEKRRLERLACRRSLSFLLKTPEVDIHYGESGEPVTDGFNLSFSHTLDYAAVAVSKLFRLGIDMESITPRILSLYPKFIGQEEMGNVNVYDPEEVTYYWCAKEAVYKIFPGIGLDFKDHIFVDRKAAKATVNVHGDKYLIRLRDYSLNSMTVILAYPEKS